LGKKKGLFKRLSAKFAIDALEEELEQVFGNITLGSDAIKTGLCIITKRADTGSTWPMINHPNGKFYSFNEGMLLRNVVRASTAAPTYFEPEKIEVAKGVRQFFEANIFRKIGYNFVGRFLCKDVPSKVSTLVF